MEKAEMVKLVNTMDSKSIARKGLRVQVPLSALLMFKKQPIDKIGKQDTQYSAD